eukprot:6182375-Pleurochrysis_carterae.AAC.2
MLHIFHVCRNSSVRHPSDGSAISSPCSPKKIFRSNRHMQLLPIYSRYKQMQVVSRIGILGSYSRKMRPYLAI